MTSALERTTLFSVLGTLSLPTHAAQVGLAVDVVAFAIHEDQLKVLLVQRRTRPHSEAWALPGGFVREDEPLEDAALRELREETGVSLEPNHLEQLYAFGQPGRDPRGRIVSVTHLVVLPHGAPAARTGLRPRRHPRARAEASHFAPRVRTFSARVFTRHLHPPRATKCVRGGAFQEAGQAQFSQTGADRGQSGPGRRAQAGRRQTRTVVPPLEEVSYERSGLGT